MWGQPPFSLADHTVRSEIGKEPLPQLLQQLVSRNIVRVTYRMCPLNRRTAHVRIYVIPEDIDGRRLLASQDAQTIQYRIKGISRLLLLVNTSLASWTGSCEKTIRRYRFDKQNSLLQIYNTLKSPVADLDARNDVAVAELFDDLQSGKLNGFKKSTQLFKYQCRTVASMLKRELNSELQPDPRLCPLQDPTGCRYYVAVLKDFCFYRSPPLYVGTNGAILSEDMGLGKTAICLALIAATKFQCSRSPERYSLLSRPRQQCLSLLEYCAINVTEKSVPWRHVEESLPDSCLSSIKSHPCYYEIPVTDEKRHHRSNFKRAAERVMLSHATLVICPDTLVEQWRLEIDKHIEANFFKVLVISNPQHKMPDIDTLNDHDIVLLSHSRFAKEEAEGAFEFVGVPRLCLCSYKSATREVDCKCPKLYQFKTPLMGLHWKRLIVDEGHILSAHSSRTVRLAARLRVERKFCVTGTPTSGLMAQLNEEVNLNEDSRHVVGRKASERQDLERLGAILTDYLRVPPWYDLKEWNKQVTKSFTESTVGSAECVRQILQQVVIRHRPKDIEVEISLPPLSHKIIRLVPSFSNRLNMNCFVAAIVANAVSSERTDQDYLFHPSNRTHLSRLVSNMQHSTFFWSAMDSKEVEAILYVCEQSLVKAEERSYSLQDCQLLKNAADACKIALASPEWKIYTTFHDMGYYVQGFPKESLNKWSFLQNTEGAIFGKQQIIAAQKLLANSRVSLGETLEVLQNSDSMGTYYAKKEEERQPKPRLQKGNAKVNTSPKKKSSSPKDKSPRKVSTRDLLRSNSWSEINTVKNNLVNSSVLNTPPFCDAKIIGTASSKLSYLLDRIVVLSDHEKIIVFYEHQDIAFYIAEALEAYGIEHLIYATTLPAARRSQYIVTFNSTETYRVMVMDIKLAAHGLNISSASRIFFVQPVWQRNIEAQAIKRAHRIGQSRPVYVETLVLADTIEEDMLERRALMTNEEQQKSKGITDDIQMRQIISNLKFLNVPAQEAKVAKFLRPREFFRSSVHEFHDPDKDMVAMEINGSYGGERFCESPTDQAQEELGEAKTAKRRKVGFVE